MNTARWWAFNISGAALMWAAHAEGLLVQAYNADPTHIVVLIVAVFLYGLILTPFCIRNNSPFKYAQRFKPLRQISSSLVFLGLIGTVVGFIIALSGVDPSSVGDQAQIQPMVAALLSGMGTALYTTLAGSVFSLWTTINANILDGR